MVSNFFLNLKVILRWFKRIFYLKFIIFLHQSMFFLINFLKHKKTILNQF